MALVLNDRVKETTTTTGTGTINLGGAATGFETFVAGIGNSNTTYYCIAGQGTAEFEVGIGTVTDASPDTLSRTTILSSSNSDSAVNFSAGTKDVFCTLPASKTIREVDTALNVPTGTTAQRAGSPAAGDLRFNTTTSKFEGYSGSAWGDIGVGNFLVTNTFTGDGSDTTFTISNAVADENNLLVFIDGVFQAQNVYSISGTTLTFATAPANGRVITVYSALNNIQGANVVKATMTGDNSDTTLALGVTPISENAVQVYFDGVYQNKDSFSISGETLTFGVAPPTGVAVEAITLTVTDLAAAASSILVDEFTGDGSDTTFTLSAAPANENNTQVFVGGVYQEKATYSISGTTLTFSEAPANTVSIEVVSVAVGQINSAIQLSDADGDTKVMVEESADEDKIRFDTGGTERMVIDSGGIELAAGSDISNASGNFTLDIVGVLNLDADNGGNVNLKDGGTLYATFQKENDDLRIISIVQDGDIILRGNDGGSYVDALTLDMSNKGRATFNEYAILGEADDARLYFTASSGYSPRIQSATNDLTIQTNNGERMRINSSGNVGIGTTAPTQKLAVNGGLVSIGAIGSPGSAGSYTFNATALDYSNDGARSWSWGGSTYRGTFNWYQLENDGENQINSMRLDSSGNLLVGTTTAINSSHSIVKDSGVPLNIKRTTNASASNSLVLGYGTGGSTANLSIRGDGDLENTNGSYGFLASDERLKENIVDVSSQWEDVKNIKIKNFTLKHDSSGLVQMGAIAQELQEVCPNLIKSREASAQDIENSGGLIKEGDEVLTYKLSIMQLKGFVALQEAMTKIEELTAKVEELESKIE